MTMQPPPPGPPSQPPAPYSGYPAGPPVTPAGQRTNVLSIVSLVLGIVSYFTGFFLAIGAVITGHIALSQIKKTGDKGRGFAIAGLILGYLSILAGIIVVVVLIFVFAAIGVAGNSVNDALEHASTSSSEPFATSDPDSGLGTQTTAEACTVLEGEIGDSISALNDNASQLQSNPAAAITALQNLSDDFGTADGEIDNPDVLEAATQTKSDLDTMIADIQAYIANPTGGSDAIVNDSSQVGSSLTALSSLCG
ncbi:DUF4190 domain-containing protein [Subtercola sp. YIM 133946]|uniref:DUF4190 domain-containing protein n=1 Tax=Subtercola sp. YIM 133946 TaxID=3118909 RepID=UPI002F91FD79